MLEVNTTDMQRRVSGSAESKDGQLCKDYLDSCYQRPGQDDHGLL